MTDPTLAFNIHDVIRLRTNVWFANLPEYFRVDSVEPNFTFERVHRLQPPTMQSSTRTVGYTSYDLGDGALLFEAAGPIMAAVGATSKWRVSVAGLLGDSTRVATSIPFYGFKPVRLKAREGLSKLARLIFMIKLIRKGYAVCHATAMSEGDNARLFVGFGGTGKSTIVAALVDQGYDFLTDDFAIVDAAGQIHCYPDWHGPYAERSGLSAARYIVHTPSHSVAGLRIRNRAAVNSIVFIERGLEEVVELDEAEAIRRINLINEAENERLWNSPLSPILRHYSYLYPAFSFEDMATRNRETVHAFVRKSRRYVVLRFRSADLANIRQLLRRV